MAVLRTRAKRDELESPNSKPVKNQEKNIGMTIVALTMDGCGEMRDSAQYAREKGIKGEYGQYGYVFSFNKPKFTYERPLYQPDWNSFPTTDGSGRTFNSTAMCIYNNKRMKGRWCPGPDSNRYGVASEGF